MPDLLSQQLRPFNSSMFSPHERHWAALLHDLPQRLGSVHCWQGWREPQGEGHLHHVPTLILAVRGPVVVHRGRSPLRLSSGEALVIGPGVWHRQDDLRQGGAAWMQGFLSTISDVQFKDASGVSWEGGVPIEPNRRLLEAILSSDDPTQRQRLLRRLIEGVLAEGLHPISAHDPPVQAMIATLWREAHRGIGARELVAASGLGRSQAYQRFTAAYGCAPHQALLDLRLSLAEGLLAAGLSTQAAARCAGFSSAHALNRRRRQADNHHSTAHRSLSGNTRQGVRD